ncbi:MAG: FIST C-terminal domain-containing protein [Proteobacteria bacterium]|nr:FIST C-terminal domain-containing protein [Pseudomonadota bacterium]MDA1133117.1 FIST C-terminal domain-containing protein [Pseudomonadota bacterium]
MNAYAYAHAGVTQDGPITQWRGWESLLDHCLQDWPLTQNGLGLVYVTEPLAGDLNDILDQLRRRTGIADWTGAVAPAICATGTEYFDTPAMAIMALGMPAGSYRLVPSISSAEGGERVLGSMSDWMAAQQPRFAIIHADPRGSGVLSLVPGLAETTQAYLVGGLTSAATGAGQIAGATTGGGLSGVLFGESVPVATGLTQGCAPIGPLRTITAMEDEFVAELDGRLALDVFKEDIGDLLARDLQRVVGYIHAAVPVRGSDTGDYMVRNLIGIDAGQGWLAIGDMLSEGDQVMFVRRDGASAVADMARMLDSLKDRAGAGIRGGVYHSCIARGPNQFGPGAQELSMIREALGDIPIIGFFGNGEISNGRLYTYTGVLSLFIES